MLYAQSAHYHLLLVVTLLGLSFKFHFVRLKVKFYLNKDMYGQVFFSFNDLFMLDLDYLSSYVACSNTTNTLNWHA